MFFVWKEHINYTFFLLEKKYTKPMSNKVAVDESKDKGRKSKYKEFLMSVWWIYQISVHWVNTLLKIIINFFKVLDKKNKMQKVILLLLSHRMIKWWKMIF